MYSFQLVSFIRRKSSVFAFLALLSFAVVSIEWHSDHDLNAKKAPSHHCCIQCCPNHNLAPLSENSNSVASSTTERQLLPEVSDFRLEIYLNQIYRPPIA